MLDAHAKLKQEVIDLHKKGFSVGEIVERLKPALNILYPEDSKITVGKSHRRIRALIEKKK